MAIASIIEGAPSLRSGSTMKNALSRSEGTSATGYASTEMSTSLPTRRWRRSPGRRCLNHGASPVGRDSSSGFRGMLQLPYPCPQMSPTAVSVSKGHNLAPRAHRLPRLPAKTAACAFAPSQRGGMSISTCWRRNRLSQRLNISSSDSRCRPCRASTSRARARSLTSISRIAR